MLPLLAALLVRQYPTAAKPVPKAYARGFSTILEADARTLVAKLAGPDFMGRGPGQPGFDKAAEYAAAWLRNEGLAPAGDGGTYFQRMFLSNAKVDPATARMEAGDERFEWGKDFAFAATGNVRMRAKLAFVKLPVGKELLETERNALRGRIVVFEPGVSRRTPGLLALFDAQDAGTLGAAALVVPTETPRVPSASFTRAEGDAAKLTTLTLSQAAAERLARLGPDVEIALEGEAKVTDELATMNVVAKIEGSDPKLKREAVVVGSHLDHLGTSERGTFWGADDDASGSSANLMIARAFVKNDVKPKRTVVFCLWTMEEKGLLGSRFYTAHPAVPLADTVAYVNMDMVGRDSDNPAWTDRAKENLDAVYASSAKIGSPELYALVVEANRAVGLNLRDDREDRTMRSDTGSFARVGIPVLKAFTGEHPDYHKMTDTPDKLNYPKMARVAQWLYLCAQELANAKGRPAYSTTGRYVRGRVRAAGDLELSPSAVVEVSLFEGDRVLDTTRLVNTGHLPQIFTLRYDAARLDPAKRYTVSARVLEAGKPMMTSTAVPVLGPEWSERGFEILVEGVKG